MWCHFCPNHWSDVIVSVAFTCEHRLSSQVRRLTEEIRHSSRVFAFQWGTLLHEIIEFDQPPRPTMPWRGLHLSMPERYPKVLPLRRSQRLSESSNTLRDINRPTPPGCSSPGTARLEIEHPAKPIHWWLVLAKSEKLCPHSTLCLAYLYAFWNNKRRTRRKSQADVCAV